MAGTNSRGYAWLTIPDKVDKSNWEWLYIRAASLGGETDGTNLVLGTRDCNTHMMPFESNIKQLASILPNNKNYTELNVNFVRPILPDTGYIYSEANVLHSGKRVATAEAKVLDKNGTLYAHSTTTCFVFPMRR